MPERVIQFGEGNFLRAFVDWHFNELNKQGLFAGKVLVVQPLKNGTVDLLNEQDGLYTLLLRGISNGRKIERTEIITSVNRGINPYADWKAFLGNAHNPDLRFMVSNTTEAGIAYSPTPFPADDCPDSFPAKVTAFLFERYKKFSGSRESGMVIIPCELIEDNGTVLKECVVRHAVDWELGSDFMKWLDESNTFCNTLVDRIVPGYPKDEIETLTKKIGYEDKLLVSGEIFHLWVIQADAGVREELPFDRAGLNVVWTDDIRPYRMLKVRILNGAHTMMAIPSFLSGIDTVKETIEDPLLKSFVRQGLFKEILPTLEVPEEVKEEFAASVLERFQNPFIRHYLSSLTLNSVSKFRVRVLPSILRYYEINGYLPEVLTFSLACLIAYYTGNCYGRDNGMKFREYKLSDSPEVVGFFEILSRHEDIAKTVREVLSNDSLWGMNLTSVPGLTEKVMSHLTNISKEGPRLPIQSLLSYISTEKVKVEKNHE